MAAQIGPDPVMGRKVRLEPWGQQGASTLGELRKAIAAADRARSLDLLDVYAWETGSLNQGYLDWIGDWIEQIARRDAPFLWPCIAAAHFHNAVYGLTAFPLELERCVPREGGVRVVEAAGGKALVHNGDNIPLQSWLDPIAASRAEVQALLEAGSFADVGPALARFHEIGKPPHDAFCDLLWLWMTMLAEHWGEGAMIDLIADSGPRLRTAGLRALQKMKVEDHVRHLAAAMRGHRSGPGEEGDIQVVEDDEKYVISFDPCGSGGRMRRRGQLDGLPARQNDPWRFGSTKEPHPMSWGRTGVPYHCLHCAAYSEMLSTDLIGYPSRINLYDPDHEKPCAWAFYKDPAKIPAEYYERIGKKKPPV